jgi:hypothetical protein
MTAPSDPRWVRVGGDNVGEYSALPASVERRGHRVRALIRLRFAQMRPSGLRQGVMQYEIDCRANTLRTERYDTYSDQGFNGTEVTPANQLRDMPIAPNSPNSRVREYLCAPR